MKDDQKDQNSGEVGKEHRGVPSSESQATSKLEAARPWAVGCRQSGPFDDSIEIAIGDASDWVIARAATDADAHLIVNAVNAHDALVAALSGLGWHSPNGVDMCWCHAKSDVDHTQQCKATQAALALANTQDTNTLASSGKSSPSD